MTFPTTSVLDSFTRANGGLGANWTNAVSPGDGSPAINTNQVTGASGAYSSAYWNVATFGADSEVYYTIATVPANTENLWGYLRLQAPGTSGVDGYLFWFTYSSGGTDTIYMARKDNDTDTQLGATINQDFSNGDAVGFEIIGSTLQLYRKPSGGSWAALSTSRSDATYGSAGNIGLGVLSNTSRIDDFGGGTVVAGTLYTQSIAGTLTSSGAVTKQDNKVIAGATSFSGLLQNQAQKVLSGALTSSSIFNGIKTALLSLSGTLNLSGLLQSQPQKITAGVLSLSGLLQKQTNKLAIGALTLSGTLSGIKTVLLSLSGAMGVSGALTKQVQVNLAGTLNSAGGLIKQAQKVLSGVLNSLGTLLAAITGSIIVNNAIDVYDGRRMPVVFEAHSAPVIYTVLPSTLMTDDRRLGTVLDSHGSSLIYGA